MLVRRFADALERDDIDGVVALLTEDAVVSMPPEPEWHQGRDAVEAFLRDRHGRRGSRGLAVCPGRRQPPAGLRLSTWSTRASGCASGMFVLGVRPDGIESITRFHDNGLLDRFGAPERL